MGYQRRVLGDNMEEHQDLSEQKLTNPEEGRVEIDFVLELSVVFGVALICLLSFLIYISVAKREAVPKEYFMKNRIPLIKKVLAVKRDIKKAQKEEEMF